MNIAQKETPACRPGLDKTSFPSGIDIKIGTPKADLAQAVSIDMLRQSIADDIESHIAQLDAAVSMLAAGSDAGFLHGLRRGQAFWNAIKSAAGELAAKTDGRGQ
ncbi:MAG TPA: hypothetical protein VIE66_04585 [Methylocella sp.]|jgi:hypothetical protein